MAMLKNAVLALAATTSLAACTTNQYGEQRLSDPGKGAAIGAAGGAVIGALTGNVLAGAAIGAAGGAIVGVVTEDRNRYRDRDGYRYYYDKRGREYRYDAQGRKAYGPRY